MTKDAWISLLVKVLLMVLTPLAAQLHISDGATLTAFATDLADIIVLAYGMYLQWNMKRVSKNAVAVLPNSGVAAADIVKGSQIAGKVVSALLIAFALSLFWAPGAMAADVVKAQASPLASLANGYPYQTQGIYFGVFTEGGGGSVEGSAVGINSNSLVTNEIGVGGTVGYAWGVPGKNVFIAAEAMFGWTNFNGAAPGFSLSGPVNFEQRFKIGTPLSSFLALLPGLNLPSAPPFPNLPNGQTVSNAQVYLMAGIKENDNSLAFGLPQFKQWAISPTLGIGTLGQLPNGVAVDVWIETVFPDKSICAGPFACARSGQKVLAGLAFYY